MNNPSPTDLRLNPSDGYAVAGTLAYRERIAMLPGAVATVTLEDVTRMDVPAEVVATQEIEITGQVPITYRLPYDPESILETHSYAVRAKIETRGRLAFCTDTNYPVLTRGSGTEADLMLKKVPRGS